MSDMIQLPGITQPQLLTNPIYTGSNFNWGEATKNGSRIPTRTIFDGIIIPATQITNNIISVARKMDEIREIFGNKPITVTSWYRDPRSNRGVGGVSNSQHILGWGVDFQIDGLDPNDVASRLSKTWQGGLGDSSAFTHVDMRQLMGRSAVRWNYGNA